MTMIIGEEQFEDKLHKVIYIDTSENIREKLNLDTML